MVELKTENLLSAELGKSSPLPDIKNVEYIHAGYEVKPDLNEEERRYLGQGLINTILPYTIQNDYNRDQQKRPIQIVVLENEYLKAVFLPEYGARLWQLYDKKNKKDLLFTNPVIQPCNFAIRNAWIAGGVEFNIGVKGHSNLTCEPMFCEIKGEDTVEFYEYERVRGLSYKITAILPKGSETLYLRTTVENENDEERYMYWWTNIAFPETENTRVIVPADDSIHCLYQENHYVLEKSKIPFDNGIDVTYPLNLPFSSDYFYKIPDGEYKWEAAVDKNGIGLLQYSSAPLKGRKLFLWGKGTGGKHWNDFLAKKDLRYIEIQAGLLYTQLEHLPMPAHSKWEWVEGYTSLNGTDEKLYGDWEQAQKAVLEQYKEKISKGTALHFDMLDTIKASSDGHRVFNGKGWGAVENTLREKVGKMPISKEIQFPKIVNEETEDWYCLIENGYLPYQSPQTAPKSYVIGEDWEKILKQSLSTEKGRHWYGYNQLGVVLYAKGDIDGAKNAWRQSIACEGNLWAERNLGMLALNEEKNVEEGLKHLQCAYDFGGKKWLCFLREYASKLVVHKQDNKWIETFYSLSDTFQEDSRLQVYLAFALFHVGELEDAKKILNPNFVLNDVKEGELSLSKLWIDLHIVIIAREDNISMEEASRIVNDRYPLPYELDFRMH